MEKDKVKKENAYEELQDKYSRLQADFENFKRRVDKEKENWLQIAQNDLFLKLLPIIDDFDRALVEHQKKERTPELEAWLVGFELIGSSLSKFLIQSGVTEIAQVATFDPELHEAVARVASDDHETDQIVELLQKGFMLKDRVLRPAKVTVAE